MDEKQFEQELLLRRYENAVLRQRDFAAFPTNSFNFYVKVVGWVCAAVAALLAYFLGHQQDLTQKIPSGDVIELISFLLNSSTYIVIVLALLTVAQIIFCLWRWYGYRRIESIITNGSVRAERVAFIYEAVYITAILLSMWLYVSGVSVLVEKLQHFGAP